MNTLIAPLLERITREVMKFTCFTDRMGLMNGKTGIVIFLYHYARYSDNPQVLAYANRLIDEITDHLSIHSELSFETGLSGIAWGVHYLIQNGFVDADADEVLEDLDHVIWDDSGKCQAKDIDMFQIGAYPHARTQYRQKNSGIWHDRIQCYLQQLRRAFTNRYSFYSLPVYPCDILHPILHCCNSWEKDESLRPLVEELAAELPLLIEISLNNEKCLVNKQFLIQQLKSSTSFGKALRTLPPKETHVTPTYMDVNKYYLNQLFYGDVGIDTNSYQSAIFRMISETKWLDELFSLLLPQNIGLGNYITGLGWALLHVLIKDKLDKDQMTPGESALLQKELQRSSQYLEFGAGKSTLIAIGCPNIRKVTSVESDPGFLKSLCSTHPGLNESIEQGKLELLPVDIGIISSWGHPVNENRREYWPEYSSIPFKKSIDYDLVLIDGRFRVACTLQACLHLPAYTRLLIHDFYNRPHYHIVLPFLDEIDRIDNMGLFSIKENNDNNLISEIIHQHEYIPGH